MKSVELRNENRGESEKKTEIPQEVLDDIICDHSYTILNRLSRENEDLKKRIEKIALEYMKGVDEEAVADDLFDDLDSIPVEDVWDNSGSTRDGYVDPNDLAWEMFEETLEPYLKEARRYHGLSMNSEMDSYYMGILKGLYRFEKESNSEYKDWAVDAPEENFETIKEEWMKKCTNRKEVEKYVKKNFPDW